MQNTNKRAMWSGVWGYKESILVLACLFVMGVCLSYVTELKISSISWPYNLISGLFMISFVVLFRLLAGVSVCFKWLSSVANAIVAISAYLVLVLLLGLISQDVNYNETLIFRTGFSHLLSSHQFLFIQLYLLVSLAMVIARRFRFSTVKDVAFTLNHVGLWLALMAIGLGAGDIQMLKMEVGKDEPEFRALNKAGEHVADLGIALQLLDFSIDYYSPKAYIISASTGDLLSDNEALEIACGNSGVLNEWSISIDSFIESSVAVDGDYHAFYNMGAAPSAHVTATHMRSHEVRNAWISCGSFMYKPAVLQLDDSCILVMAQPEAKTYESVLKVYSKSGKSFTQSLTVGHPIDIDGWKIYQTSYDTQKGKWSEFTVVELVRDPWIPLVYTGLIMLVFGAVLMIYIGKGGQDAK